MIEQNTIATTPETTSKTTVAVAVFSENAEPTIITITPFLAALAVLRARRTRATNPAGYFKAKKFYPDAAELNLVPDNVRPPSNEFPYTMLKYCRTTQHVANLFGVDATELSNAYRAAFGKRKDEAAPAGEPETSEE